MFIDFAINRELSFKFGVGVYSSTCLSSNDNLPSLSSFSLIKFSKPKLVGFSSNFFPFFILSNGALVFVDFSFNKFDCGTLLFEDLYS